MTRIMQCFQKITAKNAFGLHLIDYMSELLKKNEMDNFQVSDRRLPTAQLYSVNVLLFAGRQFDS